QRLARRLAPDAAAGAAGPRFSSGAHRAPAAPGGRGVRAERAHARAGGRNGRGGGSVAEPRLRLATSGGGEEFRVADHLARRRGGVGNGAVVSTVLELLGPIFLLVALGAALQRGGFFRVGVVPGLNRICYWVALPA